uniref:Uncharacterized protein n=1 Tax=Arundo donax TaxID=35708 RepID=A0A0A9C536_ARUDO
MLVATTLDGPVLVCKIQQIFKARCGARANVVYIQKFTCRSMWCAAKEITVKPEGSTLFHHPR